MAGALVKSASCGWPVPPGSASGSRFKTGNATLEGTFDTLDENGCMIVRTPDGYGCRSAGDVYFGSRAVPQGKLMARPDELTLRRLAVSARSA